MNQELRQRIIGAIVVTALAAIFIPMLFDDPIDDSGQSVSELLIPEPTVNTVEDPAPQLPTNAEEVVNAVDTAPVVDNAAESASNGNQEPSQDLSDNEMPADNGLEADQLPGETEDDFQEQEPASLDTGLVEEAPKSTQAIETGTVKQLSPSPVKPSGTSAAIKKPAAKEAAKPKPAPVAKTSATVSTEKASGKTKSAPELQRWSIQAGSFSKKENALALMETLKKQGLPVTLESKDSLYRLKVGPELDKKRALAMKAKLDQQNIKNILIAE